MIPDTVIRMRLTVLFLFAVFICMVWLLPQTNGHTENREYLQVTFFDVGQGDAVFIETPDGVQVLIDGGPDNSVLRELGNVMDVRDHTIDMVIATHPDKDHIGGLIDVFARYNIAAVLMTEKVGESSAATAYAAAVVKEEVQLIHARRGQEFLLGASTTLRVLFPDTNPSNMESNKTSIVLQLQYGDIEFMLTGDSPKSIEEYLVLLEGAYLESEVLKVGHHGSRTSTSELFLDEVRPEYAIVSASKENRYGHPHVEVTDMLFNKRVETFSTAEMGSITFVSDGKDVWRE